MISIWQNYKKWAYVQIIKYMMGGVIQILYTLNIATYAGYS